MNGLSHIQNGHTEAVSPNHHNGHEMFDTRDDLANVNVRELVSEHNNRRISYLPPPESNLFPDSRYVSALFKNE